MSRSDSNAPHALTIEFDGPEADPGVIDPLSVFEVAARFVELVRKVAERTEAQPLRLRGFEVLDKCTQIVLHSDAPSYLIDAIGSRVFAVAHGETVIYGTKGAAQAFRKALHEADPKLRIGQRSGAGEFQTLREPLRSSSSKVRFYETGEMRATVRKAGVLPPMVQLELPGEPRVRWLAVASEEAAQSLGGCLGKKIDVEVRIHREEDGRFISGRVLGYQPVEEGKVADWRSWYRENLSHWDEVDNIEQALGRGSDDPDRGEPRS